MKKEREWMKKVNGRPSVRAIQYPLLTGLRCTCAAKLILLRRTKRTEIGGGNPGQRMRVYRYKRAIRKRRTVFPSISGRLACGFSTSTSVCYTSGPLSRPFSASIIIIIIRSLARCFQRDFLNGTRNFVQFRRKRKRIISIERSLLGWCESKRLIKSDVNDV